MAPSAETRPPGPGFLPLPQLPLLAMLPLPVPLPENRESGRAEQCSAEQSNWTELLEEGRAVNINASVNANDRLTDGGNRGSGWLQVPRCKRYPGGRVFFFFFNPAFYLTLLFAGHAVHSLFILAAATPKRSWGFSLRAESRWGTWARRLAGWGSGWGAGWGARRVFTPA